MTTQHTPGPWLLDSDRSSDGTSLLITTTDGAFVIADCRDSDGVEDVSESEANARLIAAAPELLAALEDCVNRLQHVCAQEDKFKSIELSGRDCRDKAVHNAITVIAKAKGA